MWVRVTCLFFFFFFVLECKLCSGPCFIVLDSTVEGELIWLVEIAISGMGDGRWGVLGLALTKF